MAAAPLAPPANPYGVKRASVELAGTKTGLPVGTTLHVGRDPSRVGLLISDPQVSGLHLSLRFDGSVVQIRDERSSVGTHIDGVRLTPEQWTEVPAHGNIQAGPVQLRVVVE